MKDQDSIIIVWIFSLVLLHFELLFLFQIVAHISLVFIVPKHLVCVSNAECICQDWILDKFDHNDKSSGDFSNSIISVFSRLLKAHRA